MHASVLDLQKGLELFSECCSHAGTAEISSLSEERPEIETDELTFETFLHGSSDDGLRITLHFEELVDPPGEMQTSVSVELEDGSEDVVFELGCVLQTSEEVCTWYLEDQVSDKEDVLRALEEYEIPVELIAEFSSADQEFLEHGFVMRLIDALASALRD